MVLVGRVVADPESRTSTKGTAITKLRIPVDTGWGENMTTTWWSVTLFGSAGESASKHVRKGAHVVVSGEPQVREYEKRDGSTGYSPELKAWAWGFAAPKPQTAPADDLPF